MSENFVKLPDSQNNAIAMAVSPLHTVATPSPRLIVQDSPGNYILSVGLDGVVVEHCQDPGTALANLKNVDRDCYLIAWILKLQRRIESLEGKTQ